MSFRPFAKRIIPVLRGPVRENFFDSYSFIDQSLNEGSINPNLSETIEELTGGPYGKFWRMTLTNTTNFPGGNPPHDPKGHQISLIEPSPFAIWDALEYPARLWCWIRVSGATDPSISGIGAPRLKFRSSGGTVFDYDFPLSSLNGDYIATTTINSSPGAGGSAFTFSPGPRIRGTNGTMTTEVLFFGINGGFLDGYTAS